MWRHTFPPISTSDSPSTSLMRWAVISSHFHWKQKTDSVLIFSICAFGKSLQWIGERWVVVEQANTQCGRRKRATLSPYLLPRVKLIGIFYSLAPQQTALKQSAPAKLANPTTDGFMFFGLWTACNRCLLQASEESNQLWVCYCSRLASRACPAGDCAQVWTSKPRSTSSPSSSWIIFWSANLWIASSRSFQAPNPSPFHPGRQGLPLG